MKKKHGVFFGFAVLLIAAIFTLAGCGDNGDPSSPGGPQTATYSGTTGGKTYTLVITEGARYVAQIGDTYVLTVTQSGASAKTNSGTVTDITGGLTLTPTTGDAFTVTITGSNITGISAGTITFTGGPSEVLTGAESFTSGGGEPTISSVTVDPATATVAQGGTQAFTAQVIGTNSSAQTVTWSVVRVSGTKKALTTISAAGVLSIAIDEETGTLTVTATSTVDTSKSGTATVTVVPSGTPTVTNVSVSPATASVPKGGTKEFTATVTGTNSPDQTVTWTVARVSGTKKALTTISTAGVLSIAADEANGALTVTATSTVDPSKSGTATVTVTAPAAVPYTLIVSAVPDDTHAFYVTIGSGITWKETVGGDQQNDISRIDLLLDDDGMSYGLYNVSGWYWGHPDSNDAMLMDTYWTLTRVSDTVIKLKYTDVANEGYYFTAWGTIKPYMDTEHLATAMDVIADEMFVGYDKYAIPSHMTSPSGTATIEVRTGAPE